MLPEAKGQDLLYVSDAVESTVFVLSYPRGKLVGTLTGFSTPTGECTDAAGDVWVTNRNSAESGYLTEYAHGGSEPIATLEDPGSPIGCSVDRNTGDLAATNYTGDVAIYKNAQGSPATYSDPDIPNYFYCTYDSAGDLFVDGAASGVVAELPNGGTALQTVKLNSSVIPASIDWDGTNLAVVDNRGEPRGPTPVDRVAVSGSTGTIIGTTLLKSPGNRRTSEDPQYFLIGKNIVGANRYRHRGTGLTVLLWRYPGGGEPIKELYEGSPSIVGAVVSPAEKR